MIHGLTALLRRVQIHAEIGAQLLLTYEVFQTLRADIFIGAILCHALGYEFSHLLFSSGQRLQRGAQGFAHVKFRVVLQNLSEHLPGRVFIIAQIGKTRKRVTIH